MTVTNMYSILVVRDSGFVRYLGVCLRHIENNHTCLHRKLSLPHLRHTEQQLGCSLSVKDVFAADHAWNTVAKWHGDPSAW